MLQALPIQGRTELLPEFHTSFRAQEGLQLPLDESGSSPGYLHAEQVP